MHAARSHGSAHSRIHAARYSKQCGLSSAMLPARHTHGPAGGALLLCGQFPCICRSTFPAIISTPQQHYVQAWRAHSTQPTQPHSTRPHSPCSCSSRHCFLADQQCLPVPANQSQVQTIYPDPTPAAPRRAAPMVQGLVQPTIGSRPSLQQCGWRRENITGRKRTQPPQTSSAAQRPQASARAASRRAV
jgi:hypothetical protein